jgi:hypothetical protein
MFLRVVLRRRGARKPPATSQRLARVHGKGVEMTSFKVCRRRGTTPTIDRALRSYGRPGGTMSSADYGFGDS